MKFYCICGHSRGKHHEPLKDRKEVGGCNNLNCKCLKYYSDKSRNKKSQEILLKILFKKISPFFILMFGVLLIDLSLDNLTDRLNIDFTGMIYFLMFWFVSMYFMLLKPMEKIRVRIFSR